MEHLELVRIFFDSIESKNWEKLSEILSDDFLFWPPTLPSIDKETYIAAQKAVQQAFPDWSYHLSNVEESGNCVNAEVHITGTHKGDLVLPLKGAKVLPASNMKIEFPVERAVLSFDQGKIMEVVVEHSDSQGIASVFQLLGLK